MNEKNHENVGTGKLKKLLSGETRNKLKKNYEMIEKLKTNSEDSNHSRIFNPLNLKSFEVDVT